MTAPDPHTLVLSVAAFATGTALGIVHFRSLLAVTHLLLAGRLWGVALQMARFALLFGVLWAIAQLGPLPLICGLAGILTGRSYVIRSAP